MILAAIKKKRIEAPPHSLSICVIAWITQRKPIYPEDHFKGRIHVRVFVQARGSLWRLLKTFTSVKSRYGNCSLEIVGGHQIGEVKNKLTTRCLPCVCECFHSAVKPLELSEQWIKRSDPPGCSEDMKHTGYESKTWK